MFRECAMDGFLGTWKLVHKDNTNFDAFCDLTGIDSKEREILRDAVITIEITKDGFTYKMKSTVEGLPGVEECKWEDDALYPSTYRGINGEPMARKLKMEGGKLKQRIWHLDADLSWDAEMEREGDTLILTQRRNDIEWIQTYKKM